MSLSALTLRYEPQVIPTTPSSYLRPGSKFYGTQHSERQIYDVQVEIKHVDLAESFLCGYLRIQGKTDPETARDLQVPAVILAVELLS